MKTMFIFQVHDNDEFQHYSVVAFKIRMTLKANEELHSLKQFVQDNKNEFFSRSDRQVESPIRLRFEHPLRSMRIDFWEAEGYVTVAKVFAGRQEVP